MEKPQSPWPGIPCESDAWPFTSDYFIFEARRAVGQAVRTNIAVAWLTDDDFDSEDLVLEYLTSAYELSEAIKQLTQDLVAEARSHSKTWAEIGESLGGMKPTAAQKHFAMGPDPGRMFRKNEETMAIGLSHIAIDPPEDTEDFSDEWEGTDHVSRLRYAFNILVDTHELLSQAVDGNPEYVPLPEFEKLITKSFQKISLVSRTLLLDPETWRTVSAWRPSAFNPDSIPYGTPAVYIYYAMMHVMLISMQIERAHRKDDPHGVEPLQRYRNALALIGTGLQVLFRKDVQSMLSELEARRDDD